MEYNELLKVSYWLAPIISFVLGYVLNLVINKILMPDLVIERNIERDGLTDEPFVKISNNSRWKWKNAYEIQIFLRYSKRNDISNKYTRFHSAYIKDAVLKAGEYDRYSITYKSDKADVELYDMKNKDHKLELVVIYRNKFGTYSVIQQECALDFAGINHN